MGWPTLTPVEVCSEMMKVRYSDDRAECKVPMPLFSQSEGVEFRHSAKDEWGIQPRPLYKRIGFRDLVRFRDERLTRETAAKEAYAKAHAAESAAEASTVAPPADRSEEHTSELQSLMRSSYAVFCLKK